MRNKISNCKIVNNTKNKCNCCEYVLNNINCCSDKLEEGNWDLNNFNGICPGGLRCINNGTLSQSIKEGRVIEFEIEYEEKEYFFDYCTLKNIVEEPPGFPLGKVAGKYNRFPLYDGDLDGGLRVYGKYKKNFPDKPLITYITVVYNRVNTLPKCMESIWMQNYDNVEYIVIDGGSTDGTLDFIKAHEEHIDYYISQKDTGIYNAMNKGISLASGQYICFINSDDICQEGAAKKIAEIYQTQKGLMIAGRRKMMNEHGKVIEEIPFPRYCIHKEALFPLPVHHQSVYAHRKLFDEIGYYDESYKFIADYRWEITCISKYKDIVFTEEELSVFSIGGLTGTSSPIKRWNEWIRLLKEWFPILKDKEAEILHYSFRHFWQYCELGPILSIVKKNIQEKEFVKMIYETCWFVCQIEIIYLQRMMGKNEQNFRNCLKSLYSLFNDKELVEENCEGILKWIDGILQFSTENSNLQYRTADFKLVSKVKHCINKCYYLVKIKKINSLRIKIKEKCKNFVYSIIAKNGYLTLYTAKKQFRR